MIMKIPIPKISDSEEVLTIQKWYVNVGDTVKKGDILFDVETEKAVLEVESKYEGVVKKILIASGAHGKPNDPALILD